MNFDKWRVGRNRLDWRLASRSGNVSILFAVSVPVLVGVCGLGADVGYWYYQQRSLQSAADAAAYSGETALNGGGSSSAITSAATTAATSNGWSSSNGTISVNSPPTSGNYQNAYSVQVTLSENLPRFFSALYNSSQVAESATAVATSNGNGCLIALDPGDPPNVNGIIGAGSGGLDVSGGGTMNLTKCDIYVNATNSTSIDVTGGGTLQADNITADGSKSGSVTANDSLKTNASPATADPYASTRSIPSWSISGCDPTTSVSGTVQNPSGVKVYCTGITISALASFAPGVYIINNGSMTATATISATGATFILTSATPGTDTGIFNMKTSATLNISAPTGGTTAGIALWADANLPHNADQFYAGSVSNITGAVYLPSHLVNYSGSALATSTCFQLVADEISISGGANFTHTNCSGTGVLTPSGTGTARLAE